MVGVRRVVHKKYIRYNAPPFRTHVLYCKQDIMSALHYTSYRWAEVTCLKCIEKKKKYEKKKYKRWVMKERGEEMSDYIGQLLDPVHSITDLDSPKIEVRNTFKGKLRKIILPKHKDYRILIIEGKEHKFIKQMNGDWKEDLGE